MLSNPTTQLQFHPRPFRDGLNFVDTDAIKATCDEHAAALKTHDSAIYSLRSDDMAILNKIEGAHDLAESADLGATVAIGLGVTLGVAVLVLSVVALVQGLALRRLRRELAGLTSARPGA